MKSFRLAKTSGDGAASQEALLWLLLVVYAVERAGYARKPAIDEILIIAPPPLDAMCGTTAWAARSGLPSG